MSGPLLTVSGPAAGVTASDGGITLSVPIALKRRSGRRMVTFEGSGFESQSRTQTVTPLQLALARGHRWLRMIELGEVASMSDIARREKTDFSYVARHINLTLLAPDIVAAILDESLPEHVRLLDLAINPPMLWEKQRAWLASAGSPTRGQRSTRRRT